MDKNNSNYEIAKQIIENISSKEGSFLQWEKSIELWISNWAQEIYISNNLKKWFLENEKNYTKNKREIFNAILSKVSELSKCTVYVSLSGNLENAIGDAFVESQGKFFVFEVKKTLGCAEWRREALEKEDKSSVKKNEEFDSDPNKKLDERKIEELFGIKEITQYLKIGTNANTKTDIDIDADVNECTETDYNIKEKTEGGKNRLNLLRSIKQEPAFKNHHKCHFLVGLNSNSNNIEATKYWNFIRNGYEACKKNSTIKSLQFDYKCFSFEELKDLGCNRSEIEAYVGCLLRLNGGWSGFIVGISDKSTTIANINNAIRPERRPRPVPKHTPRPPKNNFGMKK